MKNEKCKMKNEMGGALTYREVILHFSLCIFHFALIKTDHIHA